MADEEVKNPIPVRPGESTTKISAPAGSLANMLKGGTNALSAAIMTSGHDGFNRALQVRAGAEADVALATVTPAQLRASKKIEQANAAAARVFRRGDTVYDTVNDCKCTIVELNAGATKKSHITAHKVAGKGGRSWLQREDKLKKLI